MNNFKSEDQYMHLISMARILLAEDNPFLQFVEDKTIPANIRNLAEQYSKSYAKGIIGPNKADERARQLTDMVQRAQQFETTQRGIQEQRAATLAIAQGNQQAK